MADNAGNRFEQLSREQKGGGLASEILGFLAKNRKWWLLPIIATFVIIGVLLLLSTTAAAPFIYTFF